MDLSQHLTCASLLEGRRRLRVLVSSLTDPVSSPRVPFWPAHQWSYTPAVCVWEAMRLCVYVCVTEFVRERERERVFVLQWTEWLVNQRTDKCTKDRERARERHQSLLTTEWQKWCWHLMSVTCPSPWEWTEWGNWSEGCSGDAQFYCQPPCLPSDFILNFPTHLVWRKGPNVISNDLLTQNKRQQDASLWHNGSILQSSSAAATPGYFATILCYFRLCSFFQCVCVRGYATPTCSSVACFTWTAISNHFTSWLLNKGWMCVVKPESCG